MFQKSKKVKHVSEETREKRRQYLREYRAKLKEQGKPINNPETVQKWTENRTRIRKEFAMSAKAVELFNRLKPDHMSDSEFFVEILFHYSKKKN